MPAEVTIRPVVDDDLPQLSRLMHEHARYERAGDLRPDLEAALPAMLFSARPRLNVLIAIRGSETIGYASWRMEASTWQAGEYAHLDCLYLRAAARGRGVGGMLMRAVEVAARQAGARELQWQTPVWNDGAIRFYLRSGAAESRKARFTLQLA